MVKKKGKHLKPTLISTKIQKDNFFNHPLHWIRDCHRQSTVKDCLFFYHYT